jgi:hypothetical protein
VNIEQAIHARWVATAALAALLPAENVTTGHSLRGVIPYATIERTESRPALPTNLGAAVEDVRLRITVWHDDYDAAHAIADEIHNAMDRCVLALPGGETVRIHRVDSAASQHADGIWQWTVVLRAKVHLT